MWLIPFALVTIAIVAVYFAAVVIEACAPYGYEDRDGFHYEQSASVEALETEKQTTKEQKQ